jgi:hypothetical protein
MAPIIWKRTAGLEHLLVGFSKVRSPPICPSGEIALPVPRN